MQRTKVLFLRKCYVQRKYSNISITRETTIPSLFAFLNKFSLNQSSLLQKLRVAHSKGYQTHCQLLLCTNVVTYIFEDSCNAINVSTKINVLPNVLRPAQQTPTRDIRTPDSVYFRYKCSPSEYQIQVVISSDSFSRNHIPDRTMCPPCKPPTSRTLRALFMASTQAGHTA